MTVAIAIAGFVATVAAAFGGAWYGGRFQRASNMETLALELQIDSAAQFIGTVDRFSVAYAGAWGPDTLTFTLSQHHQPIFEPLMALRSRAAAVQIVGPDDLASLAAEIVHLASERGLGNNFDPTLFADLSLSVEAFLQAALPLRPAAKDEGG